MAALRLPTSLIASFSSPIFSRFSPRFFAKGSQEGKFNSSKNKHGPPPAAELTSSEETKDPFQEIIDEYEEPQVKQIQSVSDIFDEVTPLDDVSKQDILNRFINQLMRDGKKATAERVVRGSFLHIRSQVPNKEPLDVLVSAIQNVMPLVQVRALIKGGRKYQIPSPVHSRRQMFLASKWIRESAKKRKGLNFSEKLSAELVDAYNGLGKAIDKRNELHKMAQTNRAYSHFRF